MNTQNEITQFYQHPFIQTIKDRPHWAISDKDKRPIDIKYLQWEHKIIGADVTKDYNPCVTLSELLAQIPNAANCAYYLDAIIDNFVILDVEPDCTDELKQKFLNTNYLYGEISLSGHGYHFVYELPKILLKYPAAQQKTIMKGEHKYYEILLNHWVTFTGKQIPKNENPTIDFVEIFEYLACRQTEIIRTDISIEDLKPNEIHEEDLILRTLSGQHYMKTPEDFDNDVSRYEYGHMGFLHFKMNCMLQNPMLKDRHTYTPTEKAWLLYEAAKQQIPPREKHETFRDGLPWLLYLAQEIIAKSNITNERND